MFMEPLPNRRYFKLCAGCGLCNSACTVNIDKSESTGANTTPQDIAKHMLELEKGASGEPEKLSGASPTFICTACDLCSHSCPYLVPFLDKLIEARVWIRSENVEELPVSISDMERDLFQYGNPFGYPVENRDEWVRDDYPVLDKAEIVYYPGCQTAYQLFPIEKAILKVISASGYSVTYPGPGDICCGRPIYFSGRHNDIEKVARINVDLVTSKSAKVLVANCSSCYLAFKKDYPPLVGKLPFEVYHTTEYFNILLREGRLKFKNPLNKTVVYHDPCELGRVGGVMDAPREVLSALPGVTLMDFDKHHRDGLCCGGGGLFEAVDEEQAYNIGAVLVLEAAAKKADILATACPTCNSAFNMARTNLIKAGKIEKKLKILDIAEIVAKCL